MIKLNFILSLLFLSTTFYAQINRVDYFVLTKNTIDTTNVRTFLLFNKNESIFIWNSIVNSENNEIKKGQGDEVKFTNKSTGPGTLTYLWNFGDGSPINTNQNPTHDHIQRNR